MATTKHNFYVISGGPGGGKTSILECLASNGYKYIPETARQIIKERLLKGLAPRPDPASFASEILDKDLANFNSNLDISSLLFFDRSFIDSAWQLFSSDVVAYNKRKGEYLINRYNKKVFITPPWGDIYCNDIERDQSFKESIRVYEQLAEWYRAHDYDIVMLPKDTVENRVQFILGHVTTWR